MAPRGVDTAQCHQQIRREERRGNDASFKAASRLAMVGSSACMHNREDGSSLPVTQQQGGGGSSRFADENSTTLKRKFPKLFTKRPPYKNFLPSVFICKKKKKTPILLIAAYLLVSLFLVTNGKCKLLPQSPLIF